MGHDGVELYHLAWNYSCNGNLSSPNVMDVPTVPLFTSAISLGLILERAMFVKPAREGPANFLGAMLKL